MEQQSFDSSKKVKMDPGSPCTPENSIRKRKIEDGNRLSKPFKLQKNREAGPLEEDEESESEDDDVIEVKVVPEIINLVSEDEEEQETVFDRKNSKNYNSGDHQESSDTDSSDTENYICEFENLSKTEMDSDDSDEEGYDWEDDSD